MRFWRGRIIKMKKKLRSFKCHTCKTIIFTDKPIVKCENCGSEYNQKDEKFYRENVYSKMYKDWKK